MDALFYEEALTSLYIYNIMTSMGMPKRHDQERYTIIIILQFTSCLRRFKRPIFMGVTRYDVLERIEPSLLAKRSNFVFGGWVMHKYLLVVV